MRLFRQRPGRRPRLVYPIVFSLAVSSITALALPPDALAAGGPSVPLPVVGSTPVTQQTMLARGADEATANALSGEQGQGAKVPDGGGRAGATPLSASATWSVSEQTGDFAWSYPLRVPPVPGNLAPQLALSYASSVVDGRTSAVNNQASWIGDGWDLDPGSIERTYAACPEDKEGGTVPPQVGDLCWRSDNAVASYNGAGGQLIHDPAKKVWRTKRDDGSRVEHLTGAANGAQDGEYWKITTVEGTQYFFGSRPESKSTWTVPVYGDDAGEPCHAADGKFENSSCVQAYRWNLDKVVDRNGNTMLYSYEPETNSYGQDLKDTAVSYTRGGTLKEIQYGLRADSGTTPTARVVFTTTDRCVPGSTCTFDHPTNWPDVPLSERCVAATCKDHYSPTFWSTKRLSKITTEIRSGAGLVPVDSWQLEQQFPDPGDGEKAALWLKSITHTGLAGASTANPAITLPPVTFEGVKLANRVVKLDGVGPLNRYRLAAIVSESGGVTSVTYAKPDCTAESLPANPETNTKRCFPVTWARPHYAEQTDYFQKYVVEAVTQSDSISANSESVTAYSYPDGAAWHYDTSEFTPPDKKNWNEFRGFGRVVVRGGKAFDPSGPQSYHEDFFYRGMDGDKLPPEGDQKDRKRSVTIEDSTKTAHPDHDWLSGFKMETITKNGEAGPVVSRSIVDPSWSGPTATRGEFNAYMVHPETESTFTALAGGAWRTTRKTTKYDDVGLPTDVDDQGDVTTGEDDRCSRTHYLRNAEKWLMTTVGEVEIVTVACATTPTYPRDAMSAVRMAYDGQDFGKPPTAGNPTNVQQADARPADKPSYGAGSTMKYDTYGRVTESTDPGGRTSKTAYLPEANFPVTQVTETDPKNFVTTTTLDPASGQPVKSVDANFNTSETAFDTLGRTTEVWQPNRDRARQQGNVRYSYDVSRTKPIVVTSTELGPNGNYATSTKIYDSLYRERQAQTPAPGGGRLMTDTRYDSQGRVYKTTQPYYNDAAVDGNLWVAADTAVAGLSFTEYDGAGRPTKQIFEGFGIEKWRTTKTYRGDRVDVTPPSGGIPTTSLTDARGRTTELWQYKTATPEGDHLITKYTYFKTGNLASITDPGGNVWRYDYDLRGRKILDDDPDKGISRTTYDAASQVATTTDARNQTLAFRYDELGRVTEEHADSLTGTLLAEWSYDTANWGKGQPASATRWLGGQAYTQSVTDYDALYHPIKSKTTIPAVEKGLANTYVSYNGFNPDGSQRSIGYAAAGGLSAETYSYTFDDLGNPLTSYGGLAGQGTTGYVTDTRYSRYGELQQVQFGESGKRVWTSAFFDPSTRRLDRTIVDAELSAPKQADITYTYNPIGDVTSIVDAPPAGMTGDIQCFGYDDQRRLEEAWTPASGCAAEPSAAGLGGAAPYWLSYTYDAVGNRLTETGHSLGGDTTRTSTYGAGHAVRSVTTQRPTGSTLDQFEYDAAGNTKVRKLGSAQQVMEWDAEGNLTKVTEGGKTTDYVYDANGSRLLARDPSGVTLYLAGQELHLDPSGKLLATRNYRFSDSTLAVRTDSGITWSVPDHQGTAMMSIDSGSLKVGRRRQLPFGAPRGTSDPFPGSRGFVNGYSDESTGTTTLGARQYDPVNGRFLSVDPVMDRGNPQQMNGYAYVSNSPLTKSDPTGLNEWNDVGRCIGWNGDCGIDPVAGNNINGYYSHEQLAGMGALREQNRRPAPPKRKNTIGPYTLPNSGHYDFEKLEPLAYKYLRQWSGRGDQGLERLADIIHALLTACLDLYKEGGCDALAFNSMDDDQGAVLQAMGQINENHALTFQAAFDASLVMMGLLAAGSRIPLAAGTPFADGYGSRAYSRLNFSCLGNSFEAGTKVLMADGTEKPIEAVRTGDEVLSAESASARAGVAKVVATVVGNGLKQLVDLTFSRAGRDQGGQSRVSATNGHVFWSLDRGAWVPAELLRAGEALLAAGGERVSVATVQVRAAVEPVYNLSVEATHTYYVDSGAGGVLVHNDGGGLDPINLGGDYTARIDTFTMGYGVDFEIHVYRKGQEVGVFGSEGFFNKHTKKPENIEVPPEIANSLKGKAVKIMRNSGRLPDKGLMDITGDKWKLPRLSGGGC